MVTFDISRAEIFDHDPLNVSFTKIFHLQLDEGILRLERKA